MAKRKAKDLGDESTDGSQRSSRRVSTAAKVKSHDKDTAPYVGALCTLLTVDSSSQNCPYKQVF